MPRKIRIPQSPTQSRINQQRSRARRREHVADLERRVREYQVRDGRASEEMQAAAREVNWRNGQLMELLGSLGWGKEDVERWLRERADVAGRPDGRAEDYVLERGRLVSGGHAASSISAPRTDLRVSSSTEYLMGGNDIAPLERQVAHREEETTSCDEAASMLVSLQGGHTSTTAEVRDMLGCCPKSQTEKCQVKTTKLFQLMVETT